MSFLDKTPDPAIGQTIAEIEKYLRGCTVDSEVAIRDTHAGIRVYRLAQIVEIRAKGARIKTDLAGGYGGNAWYAKSGKNCAYPKGKSRLFVPTEAIRAYIATNPSGIMTYDNYDPA